MVLTFQSATSNRLLIPIDLQYVFWRSTRLPTGIESIQGFANPIGGRPIVEKSRGEKVSGNKSLKLRRVDVRFSLKGSFASVRDRTVTISGSVPWENTLEVLVKLVPEIKSLKFSVTNTAIRFYLKKELKLEHIEKRINSSKIPGLRAEYEPEIYPGLRIKFPDGIVSNLFANGTVTAQGKNLSGFEKRLRDLLENTVKNPYKISVGGTKSPNVPIAARKNLARKRAKIIENRYEPANGWTNYREGFYVRPGPNKVPRFYEIPKNPALVRTKVLRAYANVGVNVPPLTRKALGLVSNSTAPKPKASAKKTASNWNVSPPPGMYIRPGPGGLPKFYKIPKLIKQGKKTVVASYKKAGVRVPNRVRVVFGISPNNNDGNTSRLKGNVTNNGKFRIDGLECMRYKLDELKRIAERLDIPFTRRRKEELCRDIRRKIVSPKTSPKVDFVKNGVKHSILINNRSIKRNSRTKTMNSFKIDELKNFIKRLNAYTNVSGKMTKKELVELLIERKRTLNFANNLFANFSPSSSSPKSPSPKSPSPRSGINIARNILGPNFSNSELQNFLNKYAKSPNALNRIVREFKIRKKLSEKSPIKHLARANVETM